MGDIDFDLGEMEYTDAETIEIAVEQARGLNAEEDYGEEPTTYAIITETAATSREEEVLPKGLAYAWEQQLKTQVKSEHYPDIDPRTAAHELSGYKAALHDLGLLEQDEAIVEPNTFGDACLFCDDEGHRVDVMLPSRAGLALLSAHDYEEGETFTGCTVQTLKCRRCGRESFAWSRGSGPEQGEALPQTSEELLAHICDQVCKHPTRAESQQKLDSICAECLVGRMASEAEDQRLHIVARAKERLDGLILELTESQNDAQAKRLEHEARAYLEALDTTGTLGEQETIAYEAAISEVIKRKSSTPEEPGARPYLPEKLTRQLQQLSALLQEVEEYVTGDSKLEPPPSSSTEEG